MAMTDDLEVSLLHRGMEHDLSGTELQIANRAIPESQAWNGQKFPHLLSIACFLDLFVFFFFSCLLLSVFLFFPRHCMCSEERKILDLLMFLVAFYRRSKEKEVRAQQLESQK